VHYVWFLVEKGQFTFDEVSNVLLAKRLEQTYCTFRTKCSALRLEPNVVHGPNVLHKRSAPMPIKRHEARSGPGTARPGLGDVPVGLKKQRTAAKAKNKGPHWSPVEILVGRRQPEPPNATLCLPPCCGQGHTPFTQLCAPTRAQAAALVGVHVNERHSLSPTSFRETAADKSFPGVLEQLCGSSGKHTFPTKETGRGPTKKIWTLDDAL
jgi:hypothetical protein